MNEFKINEYITLRLEEDETNIYVNGTLFRHCKYLLIEIPTEEISFFDQIDSIDDVVEMLGWTEDGQLDVTEYKIDAETEFWGHCSNIQAWVDNDYDTRILHSNLSFPLLRVLKDSGDPKAIKVFKEEVVERLKNPSKSVMNYLIEEGLLEQFNKEEMEALLTEAPNFIFNLYQKVHPEHIRRILGQIKETVPDVFLEFVENYTQELIKNEELDNMASFFYDVELKEELSVIIKNSGLNIVRFILEEFDSESEFLLYFFEESIKYAKLELKEIIIQILMEGKFEVFWSLKEHGLLDLIQKEDIKRLIYDHEPSLLDLLLNAKIKLSYHKAIKYFREIKDCFLEESLKEVMVEKLKEGELRNLINIVLFQWLQDFETFEIRNLISNENIRFYDQFLHFFSELPYEYFYEYDKSSRAIEAVDYFCSIFHKLLTSTDSEPFLLFYRKLSPRVRQSFVEFLQGLRDNRGYLTREKIGKELLAELAKDDNLQGLGYVTLNEKIYFLRGTSLKMSNLGIDGLQKIKGLEKYKELQQLDLGNNPIVTIKGLENFPNLKKLDLNRCHIKEIEGLTSLDNLESLYLVNNDIESIKNLDRLRNLKELNLEKNSISTITGLDKLKSIELLNLGQNQISEIRGLKALHNLEELTLKKNNIHAIKNLDQLKKLKKLDLSFNKITEITGLENLTNLTSLSLSYNDISEIKNLDSLTNLTELNLQNNKITEINNLDNLINLKFLDLQKNDFSELKGLEKLHKISYFRYRNDQIPTPTSLDLRNWSAVEFYRQENVIPVQYVELRGKRYEVILGTLFLRDASIRDISEIKGLTNVKGLSILDLSGNGIVKIKNLESFVRLKRLDLGRNNIGKIEGLESLVNLESLDLSQNIIRKIEGLDTLRNLKSLWLVNNKISKIENLENLVRLESTHIGNNKISVMEGLESLTTLTHLLLSGNQIKKIQGLEKLVNLKDISLGWNEIKKIEGLQSQKKLSSLSLHKNKITKIEGIAHLKNLDTFSPGLRGVNKIPFKSFRTSGKKYLSYLLRSIGINEEEGIIQCPHKDCDVYLYDEWEHCPSCLRKIPQK